MNDTALLGSDDFASEFRTNCPRQMQAPLGIASAITRQTNGTILLEALGLWCRQHRDKRIQALAKELEPDT